MRRLTIPLLKDIARPLFQGAMLLLLAGALVSAQAQSQVVVNDNGGFEDADVTVGEDTVGVTGWTFELQGDADANFIITDQGVHSGERALGVVVNGLGSSAWHIQAINEPFEVSSEKEYTFSVWLKSTSAGSAVDITAGNPDFDEFGRSSVEVGTEWAEYTFTFTPPAGDTVGRAPIHFNFADNEGDTLWVDDLSISYPKIVGEPLIVEAESGDLGSEWATETDDEDSSTYVTITTDYNETSGMADYPGVNRTISYDVTFPDTGSYDLFARIYIGDDTFNDDSWFVPVRFGELNPDSASHWQVSNGLASAGFNSPEEVVREAGGLGEGTWKWVNLTKNAYQSTTADTFMISDPDSLMRTFQVGARENGFRIDKIAFGLTDYYYTVENLNNGEVGSPTPPDEEPPVEMDPIAEGKEKWLGNIYSSAQIDGFTNYWNQVTAENAGKWGSVEGTRDQMNWGPLDAAYDLAKENGYPYRFHVLIWGGQQPGWINDLSTEEQREEIEEWMDAVAERYPDMDYVEVVNEGSNGHQLPDGQSGDANYIEALGGTGETGHDWIIESFRMARERFPDAKLMINDYGIVGNTSATRNYIDIIEDLQAEGLIDVIGVQSHAFSTRGSANGMRTTLNMLANTGLPIQSTEMDIDGDPGGSQSQSDQAQLEDIQRIFPVFWEHPAVMGVTLWGWRPGLWRTDQDAFLVRNNGDERPALEWLRNYVDSAEVEFAVSIEEELAGDMPDEFQLRQNYPNPFNPTTQIMYDVPAASEVSLKVYDITGRLIQTLVSGRKSAGTHTVQFDAGNLSSGVYLYRLETGSHAQVKRMMLIK
ncbi:endo-1,4-beta-xylanase [Gracilimonas mengyeensis]|uniref:endo-1,4-beta-xylanase n=1 Tax=Gracilimonas mengyeensis TaxID=1302730 RepID=A0A521BKF3_9BACT|nr:endo-1,4-beta-xylanase [Gracilimonas mengyeensis]SMO47556.1 endo-1,4-beta-xylanase [Gracilimonas mengyeensis]